MTELFDTSDFPPRWSCGEWSPALGWLHIASDLAIFGAYMAIPASLAWALRRRRDLPLRPVVWLFVGFILLCGLTHLVEAISLPGVKATNEALTKEIARRAEAEAAMEAARAELERRTSQLVLKEHRMRSALESARVGAVRWEIDSGKMLWDLGVRDALRLHEMDLTDVHDWSALLAPKEALAFRNAASEAVAQGRSMYTTITIQVGHRQLPAMLAARPDPMVAGQPRTMTGMLRLIVD
jgi:PAS domain-containing protein